MINIDKWKCGYRLSRDYKRLQNLLDQGYEIVCFVDYNVTIGEEEYVLKDICRCRKFDSEKESYIHYSFSSRGMGYGEIYRDRKDFSRVCEQWGVEFIDIKEVNND